MQQLENGSRLFDESSSGFVEGKNVSISSCISSQGDWGEVGAIGEVVGGSRGVGAIGEVVVGGPEVWGAKGEVVGGPGAGCEMTCAGNRGCGTTGVL